MKRDETGKFISNWEAELKQRVSLSLTQTAWKLLDEKAQKAGISRSELVEYCARGLSHELIEQFQHCCNGAFSHPQQVFEGTHQPLPIAIDVQDVTRLKQIEENLRRAEERLQLALSAARIIAWDKDLSTDQIVCSENVIEIWGKRIQTGADFLELVHPEDRPRVSANYRQALQHGESYTEEYRIVPADGHELWIHSQGHVYRNAEGEAIRIVGISIDISERKRIEAERDRLFSSEQLARLDAENERRRMKDILMQIPASIVVMTGENHVLDFVNPTFLATTGRSSNILGKPFKTAFPELSGQLLLQLQDQVYQTGEAQHLSEHRLQWKPKHSNEWVEGLFNLSYLPLKDAYHKTAGLVVYGVEVTSQVQSRLQIEALLKDLQQEEERQRFLVELNDVIRFIPNPQEILWQVVCATGRHFQVTRCTYGAIDAAQECVIVNRDYCNGVISVVGKHRLNAFGPTLIAELKQGKTVVVNDVETDPRTCGEGAKSFAAIETRSLICVPLVKAGHFVALFVLHHLHPRQWTIQEEELLERIAEQTWLAAERARAEQALRASEAQLQEALAAQQFLAESSQVLASSLDYQTTLASIAQLIVPHLADWCAVHIVDEFGTTQRLAVAHADPNKVAWAEELGHRYPYDPNSPYGVAQVIRSGVSELYSEVSDELLVASAHDAEHLRLLREIGFSSAMIVPLRVQERAGVQPQRRAVGAVAFIAAESGRRYTQADLALAEELGRRAALAVENAHLYRAAQQDREKAEAANRVKDEFLAVLSHELRSPLNPILGWTKLLQSRNFDARAVDRALSIIERNAKLQAQLIEDLLDVSRILQGKMMLNVMPVNLAPIVESALETVRLAAEAKHIAIQTQLDLAIGRVMGDASRLQQVVWNLLSNAVKFTSAGGQIEVQLKRFDNQAQIQVRDTGKGISPAFLPHVFEYFRQEDGSTTRRFGGLGLGLAIVRHLTELHGGTVQANSPGENQGATFTVTLPLAIASNPLPTGDHNPSQPPLLSQIRVLVVDDEADIRELIATILAEYQATVEVAASAAEALSRFQTFHPNVLVSDIGMPDVDGYTLIQQVRSLSSRQGGAVRAIALTAYAGELNQQRALDAGFQLHLAKPIEPAALVNAIAQLMHSTSD